MCEIRYNVSASHIHKMGKNLFNIRQKNGEKKASCAREQIYSVQPWHMVHTRSSVISSPTDCCHSFISQRQ